MPTIRNPQEVMQLQQSTSTPISRLVQTLAELMAPFSPLGMSVPTPPPPAGQDKSNLDVLTTILALAPIAAGGIGMVMKGKGESPETVSKLRKALAEMHYPGRPRVEQSIPAEVQRIEELGAGLGTVDKPHGLYTTRADIPSPHADLGGERQVLQTNPNARVLRLELQNMVEGPRGTSGESTGMGSLRQLVGEDQAKALSKLSKSEAIQLASQEFPSVDWKRYTDTQEILEGYAGMKARQAGYDALWGVDPGGRQWDEYVGLTPKAFKRGK